MLLSKTKFHTNVSRALIGQPNPAEELAMLEAKAAQTWGKTNSDIIHAFCCNVKSYPKSIWVSCHNILTTKQKLFTPRQV